jgi:glycosyltransferase involved in cell wall biosynthesis
MKIIHIIFALQTGGTESMLIDIINEQVKTDAVSLWIVNKEINDDLFNKIDPRINVVKFDRIPSGRNPIPLLKLNYLLLRNKPDVIHFHNKKGIHLILPFFRKKTAWTIHDTKIQSPFLAKYKKLFAISDAVKQDILARYGLHSTVVHNGINTSLIAVKEKQNEDSIFRIVQISRLEHLKKGQHILIEALRILVQDKKVSHIHLDFIGDGSSATFLKELVNQYHLNDYIRFLGAKEREYVYTHLCTYDLLVQPSLNEGFGLTVAEAMAAKVPVLVSDIEGPMEVIERGKYGYFCATQDATDCADKIQFIMDYIGTTNKQMIENAYQQVHVKYDIKQTASTYLNEYKQL